VFHNLFLSIFHLSIFRCKLTSLLQSNTQVLEWCCMDFWSAQVIKHWNPFQREDLWFRNASFLCPAPNWKTPWNYANKQMYKSCKAEVLFWVYKPSFWISMFAMVSMTPIYLSFSMFLLCSGSIHLMHALVCTCQVISGCIKLHPMQRFGSILCYLKLGRSVA
jgi:hypothetical protein